MTWFSLSLFSIFSLAIAELTQQNILHTTKRFNEKTSSVVTFLVQSLFTVVLIFAFNLQSELTVVWTASLFPPLLFVSFLAALGLIFYLKSFNVKSISFSSIFVSFSTVVSTTLGIIFYQESVSYIKFIGIALILFAIIFVNLKKRTLEKNNFYGLLAGFFFGCTYTIDKELVQFIHPIIYIFYGFALVSFFSFLLSPVEIVENIKLSKLKDYTGVLVSGAGYFIYNICTFFAYKLGGEVGKIDAINNSQVFLIILFEYFIFKQKGNIKLKVFSAVLAFIGVVILGLTS